MSLINSWTSQNIEWSDIADHRKETVERQQPNPYAGMKVLVIDDDPTQRLLMRDVLEASGYIVDEAADGPEGIALAYQTMPDLIILDILMPKLNGFSVCAEIRRIEKTNNIPILIATGINDAEAIQRAFTLGASDFVIKPITWNVLALRIKFMLRNNASTIPQQLGSIAAAI